MRRYDTDADFVTTSYSPTRLARLESDVIVPALQAALVAAAVGLGAGVCVLTLGGPIADLQGAELWTWAGRIAGTTGALTWAYTTVQLVIDHRRLLWAAETTDADGHQVRARDVAPVVRVELSSNNGQQVRFIDLPISDAKLRAVAVAVLRNGRAFSRPALAGVLSQGDYHKLAAALVNRGLARDLPGNKRELTAAGRAVLRRVLGDG